MEEKRTPGRVRTAAKIVFKFLLILPIPLFMMWFNFTVDRSGYFQGDQFEREVAEALLAGQDLSNYEKMDERQILRLYVQNLPEEQVPNTIALGSSRILQMDSSIADAPGFFNAGMIGADVRDVMSSLYLFIREGKIPSNVIIGVDPWLFSPCPEALDIRADDALYQEFLSQALGRTSEYTAPDQVALWKVLVDPAYFQGNVSYYFKDKEDDAHPVIVTGDEVFHQETEVKRSDGSVVYTEEYRNWPPDKVEALALEQGGTALRLNDFPELPPDKLELFDAFIQYGKGHGINFIFVLVPYHPTAYYVIQQTHQASQVYSGFFAVEPWLKDYAAQQSIPLFGSYDAMAVGLTGEDFYDGLHCRGTGIGKFFPGMGAILAQQSGAELA